MGLAVVLLPSKNLVMVSIKKREISGTIIEVWLWNGELYTVIISSC